MTKYTSDTSISVGHTTLHSEDDETHTEAVCIQVQGAVVWVGTGLARKLAGDLLRAAAYADETNGKSEPPAPDREARMEEPSRLEKLRAWYRGKHL